MRQGAPLTARAIQVQDGVDHGTHLRATRTSTSLGGRDQRFQDHPFRLGEIDFNSLGLAARGSSWWELASCAPARNPCCWKRTCPWGETAPCAPARTPCSRKQTRRRAEQNWHRHQAVSSHVDPASDRWCWEQPTAWSLPQRRAFSRLPSASLPGRRELRTAAGRRVLVPA
jgi:hypothetical protein